MRLSLHYPCKWFSRMRKRAYPHSNFVVRALHRKGFSLWWEQNSTTFQSIFQVCGAFKKSWCTEIVRCSFPLKHTNPQKTSSLLFNNDLNAILTPDKHVCFMAQTLSCPETNQSVKTIPVVCRLKFKDFPRILWKTSRNNRPWTKKWKQIQGIPVFQVAHTW